MAQSNGYKKIIMKISVEGCVECPLLVYDGIDNVCRHPDGPTIVECPSAVERHKDCPLIQVPVVIVAMDKQPSP